MTFLRRCHGFLSIRGDDRQSDKTIAENLKIRKMHYGGGLQREHFQAVESERQRPLRFWPKRTCPATKGSDSSTRGPADLPNQLRPCKAAVPLGYCKQSTSVRRNEVSAALLIVLLAAFVEPVTARGGGENRSRSKCNGQHPRIKWRCHRTLIEDVKIQAHTNQPEDISARKHLPYKEKIMKNKSTKGT